MKKNLEDIKALRSGDTIVLHYKGETLNIQKSSRPQDFKKVEALIKSGDVNKLITAFVDIKKAIEKFTKNKVTVTSGVLIDKETGHAVPPVIAKQLMRLKNAGENYKSLERFWNKLKMNPSLNSVAQLYTFIEKNQVPITDAGDLILEKGVFQESDGQLVDCHSRKFDNSIGKTVEMPRQQVQDNPSIECAPGLHVAAPQYVKKHYSSNIIVECLVNPADVVSVPRDYDATKMRVCKYKVIGLAKHSSIQELVVKMKDYEALPKMKDRRENGYEEQSLSTFKDLMKLTGKAIIAFVRKHTGKRITIDLKNKQAIAKKAEEILNAAGKTELPLSESKAEKKFIITDQTCNQIITMVIPILGNMRTNELAGNSPRRARFLAKVTPLLKEKGYTVID